MIVAIIITGAFVATVVAMLVLLKHLIDPMEDILGPVLEVLFGVEGDEPSAKGNTCPWCGGHGFVVGTDDDIHACPVCGKTGKVKERR